VALFAEWEISAIGKYFQCYKPFRANMQKAITAFIVSILALTTFNDRIYENGLEQLKPLALFYR